MKRLSSLYGVPLDYLLKEEEDDSSQSQNEGASNPDKILSSHSQENTALETGNRKNRKFLVIGLLLVLAAMLVILALVASVINDQNEGMEYYNEMKSDSFWSSSNTNEEFYLQW